MSFFLALCRSYDHYVGRRNSGGSSKLTANAGDIVSFETVGFTLNGKALSWTTADGDIDAATTITVTDGTGTANVTIDASLEANQKVDINLTATAASAYSLKTGGGSDTVTVTLGDDNGLDVTADIVDLGAGALDTLTVNLNGKALDGALAGKIDGLEVFQTTGTGAIGGTTALTFADGDFSATSVNNVIDISSAQVNAKVDFDGFTAGTVRLADNSGITNTVADGITNVGGDLTIDFGRANATVADVDADAAGNIFTFEFGASTGTQGVLFQATAVDLASGTIFDFANAVTNVGAASTATANEVIITAGANTVILFDANGDGAFSAAGDVQITLTGQNIAAAGFGVDAGGNLYIV